MDSYLDIQLIGDAECTINQVLSTFFERFHFSLVESGSRKIGISFPHLHNCSLGEFLRLHGNHSALQLYCDSDWGKGLRDYLNVAVISQVPNKVMHRHVRRVQSKSSPERLRRRLMKRHGLSEAEARQRIPDKAQNLLDLPFVTMRSSSTLQRFRLFLDHGPLQATAAEGDFNSYGLSSKGTIPWF